MCVEFCADPHQTFIAAKIVTLRYAKTSICDHKKCPLNGGEFYCVLIGSVLYWRFHCT